MPCRPAELRRSKRLEARNLRWLTVFIGNIPLMNSLGTFIKEKKKIGSKENAILEFYQQFYCVGEDQVFSESLYVLAATDHLIGMKFGMGTLDDMNHLKKNRIRSVADLLQDQFGLALVLHGRKSSYLGPGGLTGRTVSFRIRYIHPSHYGRICPIDTSEGINVGLIGSLAIHARIGDWGSIRSPFDEISDRSKEEDMVYLLPRRDEYYMITVAIGNSLALNMDIQDEQVVPSQYPPLIPFIKHNDANRALMSSNMQRQAVPLSRSEKCIIGGSAIAQQEGKVIYTETEKILLSRNGDTISIPLLMYQRSNKKTCMHQKPQVHQDKYVKKGQVLADGAATVGGEFGFGKNVLTHVTSHGPEKIINEIPHSEAHLLRNLDRNGIVMLGTWVERGNVLVGKLMPQTGKESSYALKDRLLQVILGIQKREIKVDMPYLQDGTPVDMIFNPLRVPSRMNVGQMFECSLGLTGDLLDRHYRITPFDERYEQVALRKLVFPELYEASKQKANPWVFEPEYPGKSRIFDGRTGDPFEQPVIIGKSYMLKLIHQVDEKIHGRSSGHYALVTQQPLRGRAKQGAQRVGEMEVWALEGFGVAHILQEMLTYKSDPIRALKEQLGTMIVGGTIPKPEGAPESFRLLVRELRSLALELKHFLVSEKNFQINRKVQNEKLSSRSIQLGCLQL
ncbi:hypothetical protein AMTRI_Chr12g268670 [Amborella trichopoda]